MYCSVILRGTVRETDRQYTYKIPEDLEGKVVPGFFCNVPFGFGNKTRTAVVMSVSENAGDGIKGIKEIKDLVLDYPGEFTDEKIARPYVEKQHKEIGRASCRERVCTQV